MKVKDFKRMLDTLDPESHLFINETYAPPPLSGKQKPPLKFNQSIVK